MVNESRKNANRVFQRRHKEKMYDAGFKQKVVWVKRDEEPAAVMDLKSFLSAFRRLVKDVSKEKKSRLFRDILSMAEYESRQNNS